ncbi:peptidoglycan-associated lipoprotein Pal [Sideroxydans lithotrophicus]|uniref:Peptidoglycan-associated lipoprotein n=1 Tax=Sideroxydans lithotrophicus (strain ES-1) TaxID=580332 RepID=D5CMS5_SIDLE|nr:peptidoglycan-associated lipoprotein Pal [Sideroxydans lithotrophicus]ADE10761.1 peptidoglycan-associated lipoprotein [Sideroxydans lithotrophicus ES-1]
MKKIILSIILVNLLAACATEKPKEAATEPTPAATTETTAPATAAAEPAQTSTAAEAAANAEAAIPEIRSVYFPFDVDAVQDGDRAAIQAHGAYLGKNDSVKVRVEGNADERGSTEYNLALGQRRANNVKKLLVLSGAKASQVETVSFGEEKPRCADHMESCWSQNRRADIVYITK